ncbi:TPA_asm: P3 [Ilex alphacytorhabdovirus 1]|nr:TPA_asm: P3 [Ilex alphacytorhabdovirus 1]
MANRGLRTVNDTKLVVETDESITVAIGSRDVYKGSYASSARKKEVNVTIMSTDKSNILLRHMPLFDEADINQMQSSSTNFKYIHIGCITVSIEPLVHQRYLKEYGGKIKGMCIIFDTTFEDFSESIISAHVFTLSELRTEFICYPNHCLSVTDVNISERISVLLCLDNIKVKKGNEMISLCIGHITTGTNTLSPDRYLANGESNLNKINNHDTSEVNVNDIDDTIKTTLSQAVKHDSLCISPSGADQLLIPKRSILQKLISKPPKIVVRKNYVADETPKISLPSWYMTPSAVNKPVIMSQNLCADNNEEPRMSLSAPSSPIHHFGKSLISRSDSMNKGYDSNRKYYLDKEVIMSAINNKKKEAHQKMIIK